MAETSIHVLLVEDNPVDAQLVVYTLSRIADTRYEVDQVDRLAEARQQVHEHDYDVVLLDLSLPDSRGQKTLEGMLEEASSVPIIALTGLTDEQAAVKAVQAGAQDYLVKGHADGHLLGRAIRYAMERQRLLDELELRIELIHTVAHDLKAPLFTVEGFLTLLGDDTIEAPQRTNLLRQIFLATGSMRHLLKNILELAEAGRPIFAPEEIVFAEVARHAENLVAGRIHERGVELVIADDLPNVLGDRRGVLQIVQNLLDNAVKYIGDTKRPRVEIGARHDGDETVFFVRDNGIGIEAGAEQRIFQLFEKLPLEGQRKMGDDSSGVGLALVQRIVESHGGRIWVESKGLGHGSTFCFTLPVSGSP